MTQLLRYCKAYPAKRFQEFADWPAQDQTATATAPSGSGSEDPVIGDYWFLHDNYIVTRGIVPGEEVIFDRVSPSWIEFCNSVLGFQIPSDLVDDMIPEESTTEAQALNAGA